MDVAVVNYRTTAFFALSRWGVWARVYRDIDIDIDKIQSDCKSRGL